MGLLDSFKDPEKLKAEKRQQELEQAILSNDLAATRRLIDADPGWTVSNAVLREPVMNGHLEMYKLLREKGVDYQKMYTGNMMYMEADKFRAHQKIMAGEVRIETLEQQMAEMKRELELLRPKPPAPPPPAPAPQAGKPLNP